MKQKHLYVAAFAAISLSLFSCKKETSGTTPDDKPAALALNADYTGAADKDRVALAQSLAAAFKTNPDMQAQTTTACNKKFDGDRDVLLSNLAAQPVAVTTEGQANKAVSQSTFGAVLNSVAIDNGTQSNKSENDFVASLLKSDSLLQVYFYIANIVDSASVEGIIVRPENLDSKNPVNLLVIKKDGSQTYIPSNVDPQVNYLVISHNERSDNATGTQAEKQSFKTESTRVTKITRAQFTSMAALRAVESFYDGEPDMQLKMFYSVGASATIQQCSWILPGGHWITGTWFNQSPQWQYFLIELPLWDNTNQSTDRKFIWIEQDAGDPITGSSSYDGQTVGYSISKNDVIVSESYLDYSDMSVLHTWGGIRFDVN